MILKSLYFLVCLCFTFSESFSVESIQKCSLKDSECHKNTYQKLIKDVGKPGIPELNIPPLDPIVLKDVVIEVLDLVNLTLVDGVAKGIKDCVVNKFEIDTEKWISKQDITCDFVIKGHYVLSGVSELLKRGSSALRGDGKGKVKLEKLTISMKLPMRPEKHDDGEIYMKFIVKDIEYNYDVKGKASFAVDNIFMGKDDISEFVVKYLNENWKGALKTYGKLFVNKALEYYFDFAQKFFQGIPAKHFFIEDLTPYLTD